MTFVILDLEWNGSYSKKRRTFINEIIEFGAVKFNEDMELISKFSVLVRPQIGKKISGKIKNLTHLSNEELSEGRTFTSALSKFVKFAGDSVIMTWGTSDILALMDNSQYYLTSNRLPFLKYYVDLQKYCESRMGNNMPAGQQIGLSAAAEFLNIDVAGMTLHRALDDSVLSFQCFKAMYDKESLNAFIQKADCDEFYQRITFKTAYISDPHNPLIDPAVMYIDCEMCGCRAEQKDAWEFKNRSFRAKFYCPQCQKEFIGRIQFKLKYEGLIISKKTAPLEKKADETVTDEEKTE
ncbi:MAG: exonuclease domain-containing protein [Acutalibacteraceae bacterium]